MIQKAKFVRDANLNGIEFKQNDIVVFCDKTIYKDGREVKLNDREIMELLDIETVPQPGKFITLVAKYDIVTPGYTGTPCDCIPAGEISIPKGTEIRILRDQRLALYQNDENQEMLFEVPRALGFFDIKD